MSNGTAAKASVSFVFTHVSIIPGSRVRTSGAKSYPIPSTTYEQPLPASLREAGRANMEPTCGSPCKQKSTEVARLTNRVHTNDHTIGVVSLLDSSRNARHRSTCPCATNKDIYFSR